jgi:glycosyltransferase 2 family protein
MSRLLESPEAARPQRAEATPATPRARSRLRGILAVLISVVALGAVIAWALQQETPRFPTRAGDLALLAVAIALYAVATLLRGWRWHTILNHAGVAHRAADAYALIPVGYMGNVVLPARGGEVLRIFLLAQRTGSRKREILGTIISERLLDAATLALLFAVLTWAGVAGSPVGQRPAEIAVGVLVLAALALWAYLRVRRRGRFARFAEWARPVVRASRPLLGRVGVELGAVTLLVWAIEGAIFWLVARSLSLDVSALEGCFLLVLTAFFSLIPAAPGYVGTFEAAVIFGLKAIGVKGGAALSFTLLVRFVLFVPITMAGLGLLVWSYGGLRMLRPAAHAG